MKTWVNRDYAVRHGRILHEWSRTGKYTDASGRGLTHLPPRNLFGGTEGNHETPESVSPVCLLRLEPKTEKKTAKLYDLRQMEVELHAFISRGYMELNCQIPVPLSYTQGKGPGVWWTKR
jgi:hypothetical protein